MYAIYYINTAGITFMLLCTVTHWLTKNWLYILQINLLIKVVRPWRYV